MSVIRRFTKTLNLNLRGLDYAIIAYYAKTYQKDRGDLVRRMLRRYVDADPNFDVAAFEKYVKDELLREEEDEVVREDIRQQVREYAAERRVADAPTAQKVSPRSR